MTITEMRAWINGNMYRNESDYKKQTKTKQLRKSLKVWSLFFNSTRVINSIRVVPRRPVEGNKTNDGKNCTTLKIILNKNNAVSNGKFSNFQDIMRKHTQNICRMMPTVSYSWNCSDERPNCYYRYSHIADESNIWNSGCFSNSKIEMSSQI